MGPDQHPQYPHRPEIHSAALPIIAAAEKDRDMWRDRAIHWRKWSAAFALTGIIPFFCLLILTCKLSAALNLARRQYSHLPPPTTDAPSTDDVPSPRPETWSTRSDTPCRGETAILWVTDLGSSRMAYYASGGQAHPSNYYWSSRVVPYREHWCIVTEETEQGPPVCSAVCIDHIAPRPHIRTIIGDN